jgi:hypothetical protein
MTKDQEIKLLDKMILEFGDQSYIGPWLKRIRHILIWCISVDLMPETGLWNHR